MANQQKHQQREIAIFWDYENVPLPNWCSATQAAKAIVDAVSHYGRIVDRRLYYDFEKFRYRPRDCSSLDSSGFDLVNTPTRNDKETLDKKLIADVLTFAWDSAVRNDDTKPCVVLLTGDGDYAYTLSKLRDRGIMTVVMVGRGCTVASILVDTADVAMSLEDDVLIDAKTNTPSSLSSKTMASSRTNTSPANRNDGHDPIMIEVCRSVQKATGTSEDGWSEFGSIAAHIQQAIRQAMKDAPPDVVKEKAKEARQEAESKGLIEMGRRKLNTGESTEREIIASNDKKLKLSHEVYVRMLPKGEALLRGTNISPKHKQGTKTPKTKRPMSPMDGTNKTSPQKQTRTIFLPRLPQDTDIRDVVKALEESFHVNVRRARAEFSNAPNASTCNIFIEFFDENDAGLVLNGANKGAGGEGIYVNGKSVGAIANTRSNPFPSKGSENIYYESDQLQAPSPRTPAPAKQSKKKAIKSKSPQVDTTGDSKILCLCIYNLVASQGGHEIVDLDSWVNSGAIGESFRSQLSRAYLKSSSKEDVNHRFKAARRNAIQEGFAEMGRRDLSSKDKEYVVVALDSSPTKTASRLSLELYMHLLPSGQTVALEAHSQPPESPRSLSKYIFMSGLPPQTTALPLAQYLETIECQAQRIQLKENTFKGSAAIAAHVEMVSPEDATRIIRKCKKPGGLVYCGRNIYVAIDRKPDKVKASTDIPDMAYAREESLGNVSAVTDMELTESSFHSESTSPVETEAQHVNLVDNTEHIMRRDSSTSDQKCPFEDLISLLDVDEHVTESTSNSTT